ncbi:MAG: RNase adapter RapZ [Thermoleophilia bacterium]|nr:RNase adapter RapZ [Thermoleophilia bacterium]
MEPELKIEFTIITGLSGAGKSHAMAAFEDAGFFCIDNLPPQMIPAAGDLFSLEGSKVQRVAVVSDVRGGQYFEEIDGCLNELDSKGISYRLLYMEASDEVLLRRFKETRRPHPLAPTGDIPEGIRHERKMLFALKSRADWVIDTSDLNIHELRADIVKDVVPEGSGEFIVNFVSFGFKYGTPLDADLVFDVRFLPNPHFEPELKPLSGLDKAVSNYVVRTKVIKEFFEKLTALLDYLLPHYVAEGKSSLVIGIGCTGGRHRSVAIAEWLAKHYRAGKYSYNVITRHRDLGKD